MVSLSFLVCMGPGFSSGGCNWVQYSDGFQGIYPKHIHKGHLLNDVHSSTICNSQKLEAAQMPLNRRMNRENVVHLHNGVLLSRKKNGILKFAGKWMELEKTILSEIKGDADDRKCG
ncbi:putative THO complex subunit 1 [Cricetulus griseus]|uniref:Putative THO complex subunit 1 n=1 Tax=Cricetulus griseus TaxID=10029 RepID=A0A061HZ09_CRIGR|nr:putative THO complex subunit 1 [Cricetulus griseus]